MQLFINLMDSLTENIKFSVIIYSFSYYPNLDDFLLWKMRGKVWRSKAMLLTRGTEVKGAWQDGVTQVEGRTKAELEGRRIPVELKG